MARALVFDPTLTSGWGTVIKTGSCAHYYRNGYPICSYVLRVRGPYRGRLRATRNLETNCQNCEWTLEQDEQAPW